MRPRAKVVFLILMTLGGILPLSIYFTIPAAHGMVRFSSYAELENFLLARTSCDYRNRGQLLLDGGPTPTTFPSALGVQYATATSSVSSAPSHSETNNQAAGVDELDTVETDGQYIYTVSNNTVAIVDAYPVTTAQLVSRISLVNQTIDGIFVARNRLSIVSEAPRTPYYGNVYCGPATLGVRQLAIPVCNCYTSEVQNTSITVYDITSRSSPTLKTTVTVNGTFIGARLIGDFVYLVATSPASYNQTLPMTVVNGRQIQTQATEIYHSDVSDAAFSYTTVAALDANVDDPTPTVGRYMLGTSGTIYVSLSNIFLTQPTWDQQGETVIHRISINSSSVTYQSTGTVPGHVLNQFSMDEYNGYFRVATTVDQGWTRLDSGQSTSVYVFDSSLKIVGSVGGVGKGENFHSARFVRDTAYLVTFKKTDPLFVVGLEDPTRPRVLGELNVTGYSDYLQPLDGSHLVGIGKDAVDEGSFAWYQGVKVSLFDVSDSTKPSETASYVIGDRGSNSPALQDSKAVLLDAAKNLLVIPVFVYESATPNVPNAYGTLVWQGAYVFQISPEALAFRGGITQIPNLEAPGVVINTLTITRTLYIGNTLYTISEGMIGMNDLSNLQNLGSVTLL